jgi:hypothetical protein
VLGPASSWVPRAGGVFLRQISLKLGLSKTSIITAASWAQL